MPTSTTAILLVFMVIVAEWRNHAVLGAKILALIVTASPSHHIWNRSLMLALAARGHHVTVVSPDPEKQAIPNHRDIVIEGMYEEVHANYDYEAMSKESYIKNTISVFEWGTDSCRAGLASKGAKQLQKLASNETFDLIIVETVLNECFLGFIPLFHSPPVLAITAYSSPPWAGQMMGNPDNPSYVNTFNLPFSDHMNFFQRLKNTLLYGFVLFWRDFSHMPKQQNIAENFFGKSMSPLKEIENNVSLTMVNIHYSMDYPRPTVPTLISVGGMHITPSKSLPKDIKTYLDEAKEGAIFMSLGSNVRSDKLTIETRRILLEAFSELPHKVLWKWESDTLPGQPKNVKVGKWLPQNDILGHPNVKLFITHAGLLSTQEAIYHGVPVIGIPFLADQFTNIHKCINHGVGEMVDITTMTKETFLTAMKKVLHTPSYRENMKILSSLFKDRPQTPLETAVYWTEYVIRHKGAPHLRSAALHLQWYQYLLLDVIAAFIAGIAVTTFAVYAIVNKIYKAISQMNSKHKTKME